DCPALTVQHLQAAADALRQGADVVCIPAEDGGYVLVGLHQPQPGLFGGIDWSTERVMAQTRQRARTLGLALCALAPLWDVDTPADLVRLATCPDLAALACLSAPRQASTLFVDQEMFG